MADTLTVTMVFSGLPLTLEKERIVAVDDLVNAPDIFGIARMAETPYRDFPIAWIKYDDLERGVISYFTVQSGPEVREALAQNIADLHNDPRPTSRFIDYLKAMQVAGIETVPVYRFFGQPKAGQGAWLTGLEKNVTVASLIAQREPSQTLEDWRAKQARVDGKAVVKEYRDA